MFNFKYILTLHQKTIDEWIFIERFSLNIALSLCFSLNWTSKKWNCCCLQDHRVLLAEDYQVNLREERSADRQNGKIWPKKYFKLLNLTKWIYVKSEKNHLNFSFYKNCKKKVFVVLSIFIDLINVTIE